MLKRKKVIVYTLVLSMILSQGTFVQGVKAAEASAQTSVSQSADIRMQDDFYTAINNDWLKNAVIKDGYSMAGSVVDANDKTTEQLKSIIKDVSANRNNYPKNSDERNIATLYENYLNIEQRNKQGIEPIKGILEKIKGIKSIDELATLNKDNITNPLIRMGCSVDEKDSSKYALYINPTSLELGNSDEYTNPTEESENRKKIINESYLKELSLVGYSEEEAQKKVDNVSKLMDMIAPAIIGQKESSTDDKIGDKMYNVVTIDELDAMAPNLKIKEYLKSRNAENANKIILTQPKWIKALNDIYKEENLQMFKDYIEIRNIDSASGYLGDDFKKIEEEFSNKYSGTKGNISDEERAIQLVNGAFSMPLGKIYAEKYCDSKTKEDVEGIIKSLIDNYKKRIEKIDWMSEETKKNAISKLDKMSTHVAYPDKWEDFSALDLKSYDEGGSLYENMVQLSKFSQERNMKKLNTVVDKDKFACSPQTVNAFYNPVNNSITIPAGILQEPFYYKDGSKEQNYGAIGSIIGHELSHAFDNNGAQYDSDGNMNNWWTQEDYSKFQEKTQKVRNYYNTVKMDDGSTVNGDVTVGEDIADVAGLSCSLDIVSNMDNPDYKLFFESFAKLWRDKYTQEVLTNSIKFNEHPVGKVRCNISLGQFDQFYKTFGITENDKMYIKPEDRVQIW